MDANAVSGVVKFNNTKTTQVVFKDSAGNAISFTKPPRIMLTILNSASMPFKVSDNKTGNVYSGFTIGFQSVMTCDVEWQALEKA
jgi:hypothetical protein